MSDLINKLLSKELPLCFGDSEQILALKAYHAQQEELSKNLYRVNLSYSGASCIEVRAKTEKEAKDLAVEMFESCDVVIDDIEADQVVIIEKGKPSQQEGLDEKDNVDSVL